MRRGPKGQLIILPWSPMHSAGTSLALVLQTQQQGQKWTKILQELPCLSLSIDISSLRKRDSIRFHVGFLSRAPLPFWIWETGDLYLWICFSVHFPFNDAEERSVNTKEDVSVTLHHSGFWQQSGCCLQLAGKITVVGFVVGFLRKEKTASNNWFNSEHAEP